MLDGTLDGFTLPDIFQLLAFTKKTGCLTVDGDAGTGRVYFRDGQVYFAAANTGTLALGKRLIGAGVLHVDQLESALHAQREDRRRGGDLRLGQILRDAGAIDEETLTTFVREQIQDAVFDLMRWHDGSFHFTTDGPAATIDEDIQLAVSVENLVMEGSRRLEEWDSVQRKVPSTSSVVSMAPVPDRHGVEVSLSPEEWRLLTLVDGRRTVGELVDLYGQGEFQTAKVLYGMVSTGLLEVPSDEGETDAAAWSLLRQRELLDALEASLAETDDLPASADAAEDVDEVAEVADDAVPDAPVDASAPEERDAVDPAEGRTALQVAAQELAWTADEPLDDDVYEPGVSDYRDEGPAPYIASDDGVSDVIGEIDEINDDRLFAPTDDEAAAPVLTTDPDLDTDLVQRLLDGVRGL